MYGGGGNVGGIVTKVSTGIRYNHGQGGRTISNEVDSCGRRGWLVGGVIGESGSEAKFAALTARQRCQG